MKGRLSILALLAALACSRGQAADDARVFVTGAVNQPGSFHYEQGLTVETVVERAGGVRHVCMTNRFTVIRVQGGRTYRVAASAGTVVQLGDTVSVMEVNDGENRCK